MTRWTRILVALALVAAPAVAHSESLRVDPGNWEFTTTVPGSIGGAPAKVVHTECVHDDGMTPQRFVSEAQGCKISDLRSSDRSLSWRMDCTSPAGKMNGSGSFRSSGTALSGLIEMTLEANGQHFVMKTSWDGRRIGQCP